jgi:FtsP/CotA-like multicopper oxidase with cupredoxin domain
VATLAVEGSGPPAPLPNALASVEDLRDAPLDATRELVLSMGMGMGMGGGGGMGEMGGGGMGGGGMGGGGMGAEMFTIDGKAFDPDRTDITTRLRRVEEWTVRNTSPMDHPFHLHVWPFQVVARSDGGPVGPAWKDTFNVPAGGWVRARVRFDDFDGRTVYHCHILDHEDLGMMGVIEVL